MPVYDVDKSPQVQKLARNRVRSILRLLTVATLRTLEAKISGAGPNYMRISARAISKAIRALLMFGEIRVVAAPEAELENFPGAKKSSAKVYALSSASDSEIEQKLPKVISDLAAFENVIQNHPNNPGKLAEEIVRSALSQTPGIELGPDWGNVTQHNGTRLSHAADGLVFVTGSPIIGLIEIKNVREWLYPRDIQPWQLIQNAYRIDAVPIFIARRIHQPTLRFALNPVGGIGIETLRQFMPTDTKAELAGARDKAGLGYSDLDFTEEPPPHLVRYLARLEKKLRYAYNRMRHARPIVQPYLDRLASADVSDEERYALYDELQDELTAAGFSRS